MATSMRRLGLVAAATAVLGVLMCSNPTDQDPVLIRTNIQVPLANTGVNPGTEISKLEEDNDFLDSTQRILFVDSILDANGNAVVDTQLGDVIAISLKQSDSIDDFFIEEDTLEDKIFDVTLGSIPLQNVPAFTGTIPVVAGALSGTVPFTFHGVRYVRFTAGTNTVTVNATAPAGVSFTNLVVTIQGRTATIGNVPAGGTGSATMNVAGLVISDSTVNVGLSGNATGPGNLTLSFSMNGTTVDSINALDSMARFETSFINDYDITDTVDIWYFDLKRGVFNYSMTNNTGLRLMVLGVHHDMWELTYCEDNNFTDIAQIGAVATHQDSLDYFLGRLVETHVPVRPDTTVTFTAGNVAGTRVFPQWDAAQLPQPRSETYVQYWVKTPDPVGAYISFGSGDGIIFTIRARNIWAERLSGRTMEEYNRDADTTSTPIDYPLDSSLLENFRNKLILEHVLINVAIRMDLAGSAFLDSVDMYFEISDPTSGARIDTALMLTHVNSDSVFNMALDVSNLVRAFPDSLVVWAHARIPQYTDVMLVTDPTRTAGTLGRMSIPVYVDYRIQAFCDWSVADTLSLLLGKASHVTQSENVQNILKLTERQVNLNVVITNNTNVNVRVHGIIGPDTAGEVFPSPDGITRDRKLILWSDSIDAPVSPLPYMTVTDSLRTIATQYHADNLPFGYINLLGDQGFYVPARGRTDTTIVTLTPALLDSWLRCREYSMAWVMSFMPMARDQLFDTDSIFINAKLGVEGIVSTDSLFSDWK